MSSPNGAIFLSHGYPVRGKYGEFLWESMDSFKEIYGET
jgi:hypothetical protein